LPKEGNNFEKGHSQVRKSIVKRKYKGALYQEAGKICMELIERYPLLDTFTFSTQIEGLSPEY
jgi:hypothetical protein